MLMRNRRTISLVAALFALALGGGLPDDRSSTELIDSLTAAKWKSLNLTPSPKADDGAFLRRVTLDLAGTIPSAEEVASFVNDRDPEKRIKKIDALLASERYVERWSTYWVNLLVGRKIEGGREAKMAFAGWVAEGVRSNRPYDQFIRELLSVSGRSDEKSAAWYLLAQIKKGDRSPEFIAGGVTRTFMGMRMQCAQCHNHPYEPWTQRDFYGMTAFFSRMAAKPIKEEMVAAEAKETPEKKKKNPQQMKQFELLDLRRGEAKIPDKGEIVPPTFITGEAMAEPAKGNRREEFARWLIAPENPYFAKAIVNRVWGIFMGHGIVDPIDDFRESNPPSNPELLDALAQDFVKHGYDLKYLMRSITASVPYQLSSSGGSGKDLEKHFARASLKTVSPEQLFSSLMQVTGGEEIIRKRARDRYEEARQRLINAISFLFENDEMEEATDFDGTISQALMMMNGQLTTEGIRLNSETRLAEIMKSIKDRDKRVEIVFLTVLSRYPDEKERARYREYLRSHKNEDAAYQDIFWTLLNSAEFVYIH